jgi:hypothetical protein
MGGAPDDQVARAAAGARRSTRHSRMLTLAALITIALGLAGCGGGSGEGTTNKDRDATTTTAAAAPTDGGDTADTEQTTTTAAPAPCVLVVGAELTTEDIGAGYCMLGDGVIPLLGYDCKDGSKLFVTPYGPEDEAAGWVALVNGSGTWQEGNWQATLDTCTG